MNFAAFWTFFGLLQINERHEFSKWWREKWSSDIYFPDDHEVYEFFFHFNFLLFTSFRRIF